MTENAETAKINKSLLRERNKLYTISRAVKNLPTPLFIKEMNKCIVVCSNCHKKLHNNVIRYEDKEVAKR